MATSLDEIRMWLDEDVPDERARELAVLFDEINERYPADRDGERTDARIAAYKHLAGERDREVARLNLKLAQARQAEAEALAGLRQIVTMEIAQGASKLAAARLVGRDWRTVSAWLGTPRKPAKKTKKTGGRGHVHGETEQR
ncbi:MAG TPA: hypothetical protein VK735_39525 [Pseudonocardia sp.]|uniref:hypothetical protein n=1 Tax=Pseudonocardia sp. TaxID=60912 RepID=UPI002B5854CF|nr:hypothetical protein [Pseudonocardia sp.]HTF53573.1 hypothetical protein [Pseudonocardia sp.]